MSDEEFLARWSRRKQEARAGELVPQPVDPTQAHDLPSSPSTAENIAETAADPSSLPPIESIDAATDITAFLRKGIPQELTRAALRRAWTADPAIRDFVGLAENAWDFNDPDAMSGFGPLDCSAEQLDAFVDRIVGGLRQGTERLVNSVTEAEDPAQSTASERNAELHTQEPKAVTIAVLATCDPSIKPVPDAAASQPASPTSTEREQTHLPRRTHGSALPRK